MKKMKCVLIVIFVGVLMVTSMACSNNPSSGNMENKENSEQTAASTEAASEAVKLNNTYTTRFQEVNAVTYPPFMFDYPDNWKISQEVVTPETEKVTLENDRGVEIKYAYFGYPKGYNFGTSTVSMTRVDVSKVENSNFKPGKVQGTDHSELGPFMVAKLKVTGNLKMKTDFDYTVVDGPVSYAVLPESQIGTVEGIRGPFEGEFSFWYSGYVSFTSSAPDGEFTDEEQREVNTILASFRN
ncbi:hypothetical protein GH808_06310 [Acetobacterium fimetarium]|uniref:Lipoprotein n=1 Tax=Acetobacterium fimetarium TaxID=52691 RepID=A0ABR6WTV0_9FIRM|nr:hypothetical protein [Acetobacterium fimetarium]MBC3804049.1 hypothetical protein [Acetobacterium fimetarium]